MSKCTGCGDCCLEERCSLADIYSPGPIVQLLKDGEPCPFLFYARGRYWCALVFQDTSGYVRGELLIGTECVKSLEARTEGKGHAKNQIRAENQEP